MLDFTFFEFNGTDLPYIGVSRGFVSLRTSQIDATYPERLLSKITAFRLILKHFNASSEQNYIRYDNSRPDLNQRILG